MDSVLVATQQTEYAKAIVDAIENEYNVSVMLSPDQMRKFTPPPTLLLLDHNFTDKSGIDFIITVLKSYHLPVLILTPENDHQCVVAALRVGAFNYVVKSGDYLSILALAIREAIGKFYEIEHLKETITGLKQKVEELEKQIKAQPDTTTTTDKKASSPAQAKKFNLVDEIISKFKRGEINLPALPQISTQFNNLINKGAGIHEITELLKKDLAISTKLINIANSAFYKRINKVTSLNEAINRLGLSTTKKYVEVISNRSLYAMQNKKYVQKMEQLWVHSLSCAFTAEFVSKTLRLTPKDDIFSMALIHDIGKLLLINIIGEIDVNDKNTRHINEKDFHHTLDTLHGQFGAVLLKRWDFSEEHIEVALYHDKIEQVSNPSQEFLVVHFANLLVRSIGYGSDSTEEEEIDLEESKSGFDLRIRLSEISAIKEEVNQLICEIKNTI